MNWKRFVAELLLIGLAAISSLYFLVPNFSRHVVMPSNTDNHLSVSIAVHVASCLTSGKFSELYHFPIYYPLPYTLTAGVNLFGQGALIAPLWALGLRSYPLLNNLLLLFALLMAGLGARRLFSAFDVPFGMALFGAAALTVHPVKQISYMHMNMIFFFPLLWGLADLVSYLRGGNKKKLLSMALWLFVQSLFDLSLFFFSIIIYAGAWLLGVLILRPKKGRALLEGGLAFLGAGVAVMTAFWSYLANPLGLRHGQAGFDMMTLIPGYYLFSAWHPLTVSRYSFFNIPMFIGIVAFFMVGWFFWRPDPLQPRPRVKTCFWWFCFSSAVLVPFFLPLAGRFSGSSLLLMGDIAWIILLTLLLFAFLSFYSSFSTLEKWLSWLLMVMGLAFFRAPYRLLPPEWNPFSLISRLFSLLGRLRGYRLYYYVFTVLLLIAVLGFWRWAGSVYRGKKRSRALIFSLGLLWLLESFPSRLVTGPLTDPRRGELFRQVPKTRSDSGVLILPHAKGDAYENIYLPHLLDARRPFYNGYLGVGINDPLGLYEKKILNGGAEAIAREIGREEVCAELVQGRVLTLVVDRLLLWEWNKIPGGFEGEKIRGAYMRTWRSLLSAFREARQKGLLETVATGPDGLVATVRDRLAGERACYRVGSRYLPEAFDRIQLTVFGPSGTVLQASLDGRPVGERVIVRDGQRVSWPFTAEKGRLIREIEIRASRSCEFRDFRIE